MSLKSTASILLPQADKVSRIGIGSKAQPSESKARLDTDSSHGRQLTTDMETSQAQS